MPRSRRHRRDQNAHIGLEMLARCLAKQRERKQQIIRVDLFLRHHTGVAIADGMLQTPAIVHLTFLWLALAAHETRAFPAPGAVTLRESSRSTGDLFNR